MRNEEIIRAWKDEAFRESLGLGLPVPAHPAGPMLELDDEDLLEAVGGTDPIITSLIIISLTVSIEITKD